MNQTARIGLAIILLLATGIALWQSAWPIWLVWGLLAAQTGLTAVFWRQQQQQHQQQQTTLTQLQHNQQETLTHIQTLQQQIAGFDEAQETQQTLIDELEAKNREMEQFTHTVSHDLKSPLITIKGFLSLLENDIATANEAGITRDIDHIRAATIKMEALLKDLLELSRVGRLVNPPQSIPLSDLVQEAIELMTGPLTSRQVQVIISPNLPTITGDRPRLRQVLQNLIENSIKFMGAQTNPQITIGIRHQDPPVFFVRDNGIGIAPDQQQAIFGLFHRLDNQVDGTGIGLALVKRIIELHQGSVWVESAGQGQGSTFCFTLPTNKEESDHDA